VSCLEKNHIEICIKIYTKTALACFGAVTPSSGNTLFVLTKVTVVKIVHQNT
jgi:intracellular septation protein A